MRQTKYLFNFLFIYLSNVFYGYTTVTNGKPLNLIAVEWQVLQSFKLI